MSHDWRADDYHLLAVVLFPMALGFGLIRYGLGVTIYRARRRGQSSRILSESGLLIHWAVVVPPTNRAVGWSS
jgi:hypothetical protein